MTDEIALILDSGYGDELISLSQRMPVWIIESAENDVAVSKARAADVNAQITSIRRQQGELPQHCLARALIAIDEHHGDVSQRGSPYQSVLVVGTREVPAEHLLSELELTVTDANQNGFRAVKRKQTPAAKARQESGSDSN